jgi:ABC-type lipoprotein release transport system permease subunit
MIKIAWRNIWRNKLRSFVVIMAIALGLWAGAFSAAFYEGMIKQKVDDVIRTEVSHMQWHHPDFREELQLQYYMKNGDSLLQYIAAEEGVQAVASRSICMGMMASSKRSGAVKLIGVDAAKEALLTDIHKKLEEGTYFEGRGKKPILISRKMADSYGLKLRSKVVMTLQGLDGEMTAAAFRVVGIYRSGNGMLDELNAYVRRIDVQQLIGLQPTDCHEIAVLLKEHQQAEPLAAHFQEEHPSYEVLSWLDLSLGMRYMMEASSTFAYVLLSIILVALLFSVINTMLMAVMERTREIGMLMAVGMNKTKVFVMIMWETFFLSMLGTPIGLGVAYLTIQLTGTKGIKLGEVYEEMGFSTLVYPELAAESYVVISSMVLCMAIVASIYPARKALQLNPTDAIRKI